MSNKSVYRKAEAWIVGCGGVCYQAMPWLMQTLKKLNVDSVTIWDADKITRENQSRQWADALLCTSKAANVQQRLTMAGVNAFARSTMFDIMSPIALRLEPEEEAIPLYVFAWPDSNNVRLEVEKAAWSAAEQGWTVIGTTAGCGVELANGYPLYIPPRPVDSRDVRAVLWSDVLDSDEALAEKNGPQESCRMGAPEQTVFSNLAAAFCSAEAFEIARVNAQGITKRCGVFWNGECQQHIVQVLPTKIGGAR